MKKVFKKFQPSVLVLSLTFALALTGCVSNLLDKTPKQQDVQQSLSVGSTTKAEVEAKFGKPTSVSSKKGADTWTYVWGADGSGNAVGDSVKTAAWGAGHVATGQAMVHAANAGASAGGMAGGVAAGMLAAEAGSRLTNAATGIGTGKSNSSSTQPTQLIVYFDKKGIVTDYKYSGNK